MDIKYTEIVYPDWTVEEIAKELARYHESIQNANKDPEVHIERDMLFKCFASKIKEWAESKLRYGTFKVTYKTNNSNMKSADDLYNPCTNCPNNKGPGTICYCTLASPKIIY